MAANGTDLDTTDPPVESVDVPKTLPDPPILTETDSAPLDQVRRSAHVGQQLEGSHFQCSDVHASCREALSARGRCCSVCAQAEESAAAARERALLAQLAAKGAELVAKGEELEAALGRIEHLQCAAKASGEAHSSLQQEAAGLKQQVKALARANEALAEERDLLVTERDTARWVPDCPGLLVMPPEDRCQLGCRRGKRLRLDGLPDRLCAPCRAEVKAAKVAAGEPDQALLPEEPPADVGKVMQAEDPALLPDDPLAPIPAHADVTPDGSQHSEVCTPASPAGVSALVV